jgi:hypothetical protein
MVIIHKKIWPDLGYKLVHPKGVPITFKELATSWFTHGAKW